MVHFYVLILRPAVLGCCVMWEWLWYSCCCCSATKLCLTLCNPMDCNTPGFPVPHPLLEFSQVRIHWIYDTIQPSQPLSPSSSSVFSLSQHQDLFQWVKFSLHQVAKVLELQHQSFQRVFMVDFFYMDWLDLLAVQRTHKGLLQHHSSKAWILQCSAFFMIQLSHLYMTTGETRALTIWTFCQQSDVFAF